MQQANEDDSNQHDSSKGLPISSSSSSSSSSTQKNMKKVADYSQLLPWDVLDVISKKLDFDDLFQFAGVCKNWNEFHKIYWRNFLKLQSPLIVQTSSYAKKAILFVSIADQKVYHSKMDYFRGLSYCGSSGGYLIMAGANDTLLLMNPFTRRKKVIDTLALRGNLFYLSCHALLAFAKGSDQEFVIAVRCKSSDSLHIYQSRNSSWVTYSRDGNPWNVVDFAVLHNTIYVITDKANIGVLSLNFPNIKFLELKNTPGASFHPLGLVNCDEQLLVIHFLHMQRPNVYKIDLSTMSYVKLENLGNTALFCAIGRRCFALSNPGKWGYESNSMYYCSPADCVMQSWDNSIRKKVIMPSSHQAPPRSRQYSLGWCFRHLHDEIDYSLVD